VDPTPLEKKRRAYWELAMVALALASIGPIVWIELEGLQWPHPTFQLVAAIDLGVVLILGTDFSFRLWRADGRARFFKENWVELLGLVPLYAESLSWFRLARLLRLGRVLRLLRVVTAMQRMNRTFRFLDVLINRSKLGYVLVLAAAVVVSMASVVWILERHTNPGLSNFNDALWWAIVTTTTVGYGDITPQTGLARVFATVLMLLGIGLIGVVASSLSTALLTTDHECERQLRSDAV
jgi:voltage-gated potassium channel